VLAQGPDHYVLPDSFSTPVVAAILALTVAVWVGLHLLKPRIVWPKVRAAMFVARIAAGFACLLAAGQVAVRCMLLTTNWRLWPIALGGAAAVEVLLGLYGLERRTVSRRAGLALTALRVGLVLLVIAMLTQPVFSWELIEDIQRYVAVLVDDSASMLVSDPQRTPSEKLRLAEALSVRAARRPYRLESIAEQLQAVRRRVVALGEGLAVLADADAGARQQDLGARRQDLHAAIARAHDTIQEQLKGFSVGVDGQLALDDRTKSALRDAKAALAVGVRDRLAEAMKITEADNASRLGGQYERLTHAIRSGADGMAKLATTVASLAETLDAKHYASLTPQKRRAVDEAAGRTRLALARQVLVHRPVSDFAKQTTDPSLLEKLSDAYRVKLYTFAADCVETDLADWKPEPAAQSQPATRAAASRPSADRIGTPRQQRTDLAGALEKVMAEMSGKQLAGVVLLVDGRHNAPRRVEPPAEQLGRQNVPLCSIVMGADHPPRDAAVVSVDAPDTVVERDRLLVNAMVKLDGLGGQGVEVALYDANRRIEARTIRVPAGVPSFRTRVQFSDEPKSSGLHPYRVAIKAVDEEVFTANNEYPLTVSVTKDRTRLLLIEARPRWEFRYVKNIFADRDRAVKLQYVLLSPDRIAGQGKPAAVPASASRPLGQIEATALPASAAEWMKFDAIVLGDVPPSALPDGQMQAIRKFVTERGGTLIVIAGPNYMPHAFSRTALAEILPTTAEPTEGFVGGARKTGFRIALTTAGRDSVVMRQQVEPERNQAVWDAVPDLFWRHPTTAAKEAASVLAYAMPPSPPEFLRPPPPEQASDEQLLRKREFQRRQFERDNALIVVHHVAAGRVMMLATDRTWRLRYRVGDTYHHKFWGQVMRWATANKLPAGTDFVKLGTDRTRYGPGRPIRVRAKIVQPDLTPVVSKNVAVKVHAGRKLLLRKALEYVEGSAGLYQAEIAQLPSGTYRVELEAGEAEPILAAEKVKKVVTEFSVDPVVGAEQVELSADRGLLRRLANVTGGVVLDPHQAARVADALGEKSLQRREPRELRLWDSWPLLILIVILASCEWILRKRVGLA